MSRQKAFESIYAKQHDVPAESLVQYRFESKDGYSHPQMASHYRTYCETLDSIVVDLPEGFTHHGSSDTTHYVFEAGSITSALTAAGVKYK